MYRAKAAGRNRVMVAGALPCPAAAARAAADTRPARVELETGAMPLDEALRAAQSARVDPLTGLVNRVGFEGRLEQAFAQAQRLGRRHGRSFAVAFLELNGLATPGDTDGQEAGNRVLKEVAAILIRTVRPADLVGHYGGGKFALLLLQLTDAAMAAQIAERICGALEALDANGRPVSAGFGIALAPDHAADREGLLHLADLALAASQAGQNRVTLAAGLAPGAAPGAVVDGEGAAGR